MSSHRRRWQRPHTAHVTPVVRRCLLLAAIVIGVLCPHAAAAEAVSTYAGDGRTGNQDGDARSSSFMLPLGLAYDAVGNLFVADGAGQRIREIGADGHVRTLSGGGEPVDNGFWVAGGHADGPGTIARFNRPLGIVVAADGSLFVADTYNNCIRRVMPQGDTTSYVGEPARELFAAGPRAAASVHAPVGLAIDREQNLYTTTRDGIVKIAPDGLVSALTFGPGFGFAGQLGIAAGEGPHGPTLFVADVSGLYVRKADGAVRYFRNARFEVRCRQPETSAACAQQPAAKVVGSKSVGSPLGVAALNDHLVAYTDARSNSVRILDVDSGTVRSIAGSGYDEGSPFSAGYRDGDGQSSRFSSPVGIALDSQGRLAVADAGNRRIRRISGIDRHEALAGDRISAFRAPSDQRAIAYAGDASIWPGLRWDETVEGLIETRVQARAGARPVRILPVVLSDEDGDSLRAFDAAMTGTAKRFDAVFLELRSHDAARFAAIPKTALGEQTRWRPGLTIFLRRIRTVLSSAGTGLFVVVQPDARQTAPAEAMWERLIAEPVSAQPPTDTAGAIVRSARDAGVGVVDVRGAFFSAARQGRGPLFAASGGELAATGRDIVADAVARALRQR